MKNKEREIIDFEKKMVTMNAEKLFTGKEDVLMVFLQYL